MLFGASSYFTHLYAYLYFSPSQNLSDPNNVLCRVTSLPYIYYIGCIGEVNEALGCAGEEQITF